MNVGFIALIVRSNWRFAFSWIIHLIQRNFRLAGILIVS